MGQSQPLLAVENLITGFLIQNSWCHAVDSVSFVVEKGKTLGIVGESGCGKSVTSLSILRLISNPPGKIMGGKVLFQGQNLLDFSEKEMQKIRGNQISMIFQEPMTSLNPVYTVGRQIAEVFMLHKGMSRQEAKEASIGMLRQVRISSPEKRFEEFPHQLSGGMRQRVMIAMALACQPQLLIADEPTTALDVTIQAQILALINQLQQDVQMGVMLITHDLDVVAETCDDVMIMYAGRVVEKASVKDLFHRPLHPYTQGLLRSIPRLGQKKHRLETIPGMVPSLGRFPTGCRFQDRCPLVTPKCRLQEPSLVSIGNKHEVACFVATQNHSE